MRVAIIGGGLSGSLACMQLLRASEDVHVSLIERRSRQLNRGVAYSARISRQLLNVPASRMGLFPEDPEGFLRWAKSGPLPSAVANDFLPRSLFGDFVHDQFHDLVDRNSARVDIVRADAIALDHDPTRGYAVQLHNGQTVHADLVLLALGNAPPGHVPNLGDAAQKHPAYIGWPWQHGALNGIGNDDHVLFVGAGLTMVDVLLSLLDQGHKGPVTVLSRRGHLPRPHAVPAPWALTDPLPRPDEVTAPGLMKWVRREVELAAGAGFPWQSVMDAVKPLVQGWWQAMPRTERERFLRHVRPFWEVHRHRMPSEAHERLNDLQRSGQLRLVAANVEAVEPVGDLLRASFRVRGSAERGTIDVARLINCTGPQTDTRRMEQPLLKSLMENGFASWDDLHLGLRCTPSGALVSASGRASESLYAIGPLCKATLWECTAVPEIRAQAAGIATRLVTVGASPQRGGTRRSLRRFLDRLSVAEN